MQTKEKILSCAQALFRERGYNGVSLRDVAEAAGLSIGNLTYHFPKKESLVEALFAVSAGQAQLPDRLETPADFTTFFRHVLAVQRRAAFYFDSYVQLSQSSQTLRELQCRRIDALRALFLDGLERLAAGGNIPPARCEGELADRTEVLLHVLMLRLPGGERLGAEEGQDEACLRRLHAAIGLPPPEDSIPSR